MVPILPNFLTFAAKIQSLYQKQEFLYRLQFIAVVLLAPALLINLGLLAMIDDEGIRSLVALEMKLSGNLITPTLHGEFYYNKPPLYNWILLAVFELSGSINEFTARFPTVLALLGYGATIYYFTRPHLGGKGAFLSAFFLITCGRMLFWDSILALIDTTFSWVIFTLFMVIFQEFQKGRFFRLFLFSYLLTAAGFMLKGLPAIVFQGVTLLVYFSYRRQFKKLFSWEHIAGGLVFVLIVGAYYLLYHQYNSLENVFTTLFSESSKRTVANYGIGKVILHFLAFPFEMIYHFLPWTLLVIYLFRRDLLSLLHQSPFIVFCLIAFLANILVYWTSPEVYPRYLLMLVPLAFIPFVYLHPVHRQENTWQYRSLSRLFLFVCPLVALGSFAPLFLERTQVNSFLLPKTLLIGLSLSALAFLYWKLKEERLLVLILFLLVVRIGFNWFVLPDRNRNDYGDLVRITSEEVGRKYAGRPLYVYKYTIMHPTNSFYITNERRKIVPVEQADFGEDRLFIINPGQYPEQPYRKIDEIKVRHGALFYDVGVLE